MGTQGGKQVEYAQSEAQGGIFGIPGSDLTNFSARTLAMRLGQDWRLARCRGLWLVAR